MRWDRGYRSSDVEDRRGMSAGGGGGGLVWVLIWVFRKFGIVGVLVAIVGYGLLAGWFSGGGSGIGSGAGRGARGSAQEEELVSFVSFVLDDAQGTWTGLFQNRGDRYRKATLVLFTDRVRSACGMASAAVGPFYCPADQKVYIDLGFYQALRDRLGAPGDFAQAYVIAHEIGHHVQHQLGTTAKGDGATGGSVRTELQADCFAGVWAHSTSERQLLERGDIDEALTAAAAIGDDALQRQSSGSVRPETFTHGTSEQRSRWFRRGFESGQIDACDTFAAQRL